MDKEVICCSHVKCSNCNHPLFVECDFIEGELIELIYDDATDDSVELTHCPICGIELTEIEY